MEEWFYRPPVLVGERVVWLGSGTGIPQCGVVRWIGHLPGMGPDLSVGLELDNPLPYGGIDGKWAGRQLFACQPKHGLFVPVARIILEKELFLMQEKFGFLSNHSPLLNDGGNQQSPSFHAGTYPARGHLVSPAESARGLPEGKPVTTERTRRHVINGQNIPPPVERPLRKKEIQKLLSQAVPLEESTPQCRPQSILKKTSGSDGSSTPATRRSYIEPEYVSQNWYDADDDLYDFADFKSACYGLPEADTVTNQSSADVISCYESIGATTCYESVRASSVCESFDATSCYESADVFSCYESVLTNSTKEFQLDHHESNESLEVEEGNKSDFETSEVRKQSENVGEQKEKMNNLNKEDRVNAPEPDNLDSSLEEVDEVVDVIYSQKNNEAPTSKAADNVSIGSAASYSTNSISRREKSGFFSFLKWFRKGKDDTYVKSGVQKVPADELQSQSSSCVSINTLVSTTSSFAFVPGQLYRGPFRLEKKISVGPETDTYRRRLRQRDRIRELDKNLTLKRKYRLFGSAISINKEKDKTIIDSRVQKNTEARPQPETPHAESDSTNEVKLGKESPGSKNSTFGRKKRKAPAPPVVEVKQEHYNDLSLPSTLEHKLRDRKAGDSGSFKLDNMSHRRSNSESAKDKKAGAYCHVKGKRKAPPPPLQNQDAYPETEEHSKTNSFGKFRSPFGSFGKKRRAPRPPMYDDEELENDDANSRAKNARRKEDKEIQASNQEGSVSRLSPEERQKLINNISLLKAQAKRRSVSSPPGSPNLGWRNIDADDEDDVNLNVVEKREVVCNDSLKLERGVLKPNKAIPKVGKDASAENKASMSPRPWYKRNISKDYGKKEIFKSLEKKEKEEPWMPEVGYSRTSTALPNESTFNIFSNLVRGDEAKKNEDKKKKDEKEKRKSQVSMLANISELDREAAEIVQREQNREKALLAAEDAKYYSYPEVPAIQRQESVSNDDSPKTKAEKKSTTRELISLFNAISNVSRITVNSSFFPKEIEKKLSFGGGESSKGAERQAGTKQKGEKTESVSSPGAKKKHSNPIGIKDSDPPIRTASIVETRSMAGPSAPTISEIEEKPKSQVIYEANRYRRHHSPSPSIPTIAEQSESASSVLSTPASTLGEKKIQAAEPSVAESPTKPEPLQEAKTIVIWVCPRCTLENPRWRLTCDACEMWRPAIREEKTVFEGGVDEVVPREEVPRLTHHVEAKLENGTSKVSPPDKITDNAAATKIVKPLQVNCEMKGPPTKYGEMLKDQGNVVSSTHPSKVISVNDKSPAKLNSHSEEETRAKATSMIQNVVPEKQNANKAQNNGKDIPSMPANFIGGRTKQDDKKQIAVVSQVVPVLQGPGKDSEPSIIEDPDFEEVRKARLAFFNRNSKTEDDFKENALEVICGSKILDNVSGITATDQVKGITPKEPLKQKNNEELKHLDTSNTKVLQEGQQKSKGAISKKVESKAVETQRTSFPESMAVIVPVTTKQSNAKKNDSGGTHQEKVSVSVNTKEDSGMCMLQEITVMTASVSKTNASTSTEHKKFLATSQPSISNGHASNYAVVKKSEVKAVASTGILNKSSSSTVKEAIAVPSQERALHSVADTKDVGCNKPLTVGGRDRKPPVDNGVKSAGDVLYAKRESAMQASASTDINRYDNLIKKQSDEDKQKLKEILKEMKNSLPHKPHASPSVNDVPKATVEASKPEIKSERVIPKQDIPSTNKPAEHRKSRDATTETKQNDAQKLGAIKKVPQKPVRRDNKQSLANGIVDKKLKSDTAQHNGYAELKVASETSGKVLASGSNSQVAEALLITTETVYEEVIVKKAPKNTEPEKPAKVSTSVQTSGIVRKLQPMPRTRRSKTEPAVPPTASSPVQVPITVEELSAGITGANQPGETAIAIKGGKLYTSLSKDARIGKGTFELIGAKDFASIEATKVGNEVKAVVHVYANVPVPVAIPVCTVPQTEKQVVSQALKSVLKDASHSGDVRKVNSSQQTQSPCPQDSREGSSSSHETPRTPHNVSWKDPAEPAKASGKTQESTQDTPKSKPPPHPSPIPPSRSGPEPVKAEVRDERPTSGATSDAGSVASSDYSEVERLTAQLTKPKGLADFKADLEASPPELNMNTLAINRLLRRLEAAIAGGQHHQAARLARELARLKISCSVTRHRRSLDTSPAAIMVEMYVEDKVSHQGPIPLQIIPTMTVGELKEKVEQEFEIPVGVQRWILGKQLASDDTKTLEVHNVNANGCPIFLYLVAPDPDQETEIPEGDVAIGGTIPEEPEKMEGPPSPAKGGGWYYNFEEDHYSFCEDTESELSQDVSRETSPPASPENGHVLISSALASMGVAVADVLVDQAEAGTSGEQAVNDSATETVEKPNKTGTLVLGWTCPICTLVNAPTRPGCAACTTERPTGYVIPTEYEANKQEADRMRREEELDHELEQAKAHEKQEAEAEQHQHYLQLVNLDNTDVVQNSEHFECSVCFTNVAVGEGVILRECLHTFCRPCLVNTIQFTEEAEVKCPYRDADYACDSVLQEREIKALVPPAVYEHHLEKSVAQAENKILNAFHCKTPDCKGWCIYEDNVNEFRCPVCTKTNCLTCQAVHDGMNCKEYQEHVNQESATNAEARRTKEMLEEMVQRGEAMNCPTCQVVLMKKWGCDWLRCSMCKTEICWVTRGPRWGPGGKGDTSGGCQCGVNGIKCHPRCNYCH